MGGSNYWVLLTSTWVLLLLLQEEKANLLEELAELHTKMEELKARAFATCAGVNTRTPSQTQGANRLLRQAIQKQQLECTRIHALMSEYSLFVSSTPLCCSWGERRSHGVFIGFFCRIFALAVLYIGRSTYIGIRTLDGLRCWRSRARFCKTALSFSMTGGRVWTR